MAEEGVECELFSLLTRKNTGVYTSRTTESHGKSRKFRELAINLSTAKQGIFRGYQRQTCQLAPW